MIYQDSHRLITIFLILFLVLILSLLYVFIPEQEKFCGNNRDWYYGIENFESFPRYKDDPEQKFMNTQINECKKLGYKPAYNPMVCTEGKGLERKYKYYKNCMCVDNKNECTLCMDQPKKINLV